MPLEPRFRRVAALHRRFVDRVPILTAFTRELEQAGHSPRVFNVIGVGGIGKSRLLRELKDRSARTHRTCVLDLQVPAMRQQEDAMAVIRVELGRQGVKFDRFDIAYAVLWQRLHPHLRLSRSQLPFIAESEALTQILDSTAGVPVFGTSVGLVRLVEKAATGVKRRRQIKIDDTLRGLDDLGNAELADAVTYLFAEDLRASSFDKPYVLFIDAYEALTPGHAHSGRAAAADVWLRDLIAQLDRGLVVVASREPLGWEVHDPGWADVVTSCRVDGLPMEARLELLTEGGITDIRTRDAIAVASQGLPFYLHLAVDTQTSARSSTAHQTATVSAEEILQRFLQHVVPDEIRTLELLSVARVFDFEIFQAIADAFGLPRHRMAWESLTAYSFVYPAGAHGRRLHQLMRAALHQRLSQATIRDVQTLLQGVWDSRSEQEHSTENGIATLSRAVREACFCGLHAGTLTGSGVVAYADRALAYGGKQGVDGVLHDLQDYLDAGSGDLDLANTARCLQAETAVLLGDASTAVELTPVIDWDLSDTVGARLALAAAHGRRIAGDTAEAQYAFTQVWNTNQGLVRLRAGYCMADLDMCQGRFRDTFATAEQILAEAPPDDYLLRGDVMRLQHLGYRFMLDFDASHRSLEAAAHLYEQAGAMIEQANILTNRAELLAWTQPEAAIRAAAAAIEKQLEHGAQHELGKAYTALAVAQLRLGQHEESAVAFRAAVEALERARYRSGRARAELFRALLYAQTGDFNKAASAARWSVAELIQADVYPTLIMLAGQFLHTIGIADEYVDAAAHRARGQIQIPAADFEARTAALMSALLGVTQ
jgi:tetratricopeptide (TPR) repeat protein